MRIGAVNLLALGYVNTSDNKIIAELLQIAATDLSNDVRRAAVIAIAFVMLNNINKAIILLKMLSKSYNDYVRHAVALSLGIIGAHSFNKEIHNLLMNLFEDDSFHVKSASAIALGMVHQLGNPIFDKSFLEVRNKLKDCIDKKYEDSISKLGCYMGLGLMQSGGGNSTLSLLTRDGRLKLKNISSVFLFTQYWYWFPLMNMLGLALEPSYLVGVLKENGVPRGFQFVSQRPKSFFDYYKKKLDEKKKDDKGPAILSVTKKVKARKGEVVVEKEVEKP